jgi:hypothetical protein
MLGLIEALKSAGNEPDYWRTVNGNRVGFKGEPGSGVQVAGRPLDGGSGSKAEPKRTRAFGDGKKLSYAGLWKIGTFKGHPSSRMIQDLDYMVGNMSSRQYAAASAEADEAEAAVKAYEAAHKAAVKEAWTVSGAPHAVKRDLDWKGTGSALYKLQDLATGSAKDALQALSVAGNRVRDAARALADAKWSKE